ncbi:MAG: exonuclease SbcCD subunit D C-terminal domain-containing protein [Saprospiraceae bacterium]|nr:exonuclease SbcCD subunit D C-terminal domain-containing protein [Saprospiraceae bacterium]
MKIIHTADWHIGKILHKHELTEDIKLFFDWLVNYLIVEDIDVLLVSGDIFDLANPSNQDAKLYYDMLFRLSKTKTKVIITGGNHDSVSLLDAPSHLLDTLNIKVIGGCRENIQDEIVPIYDLNGKLVCVILAVPFLRDRDLRASMQASESQDKSEIMSLAIKYHYDTLVEMSHNIYGEHIPIIAMGHLYMKGSITSDSERDIHIGNLQGLESKIIHPDIMYMALGHIHKPQRINNLDHIRYSGSAVFLDFSERDYSKMVIRIDITKHKIDKISPVMIPKSREIIKISGNLESVLQDLSSYEKQLPLKTLIEIEVLEPIFDPIKIQVLEDLVSTQNNEKYKILKSRILFTSKFDTDHNLAENIITINELDPLDIFDQKLNENNITVGEKQRLREAYIVMMEEINE